MDSLSLSNSGARIGLSNYNYGDGMNLLKNMDMEILHFLLAEGFRLWKIRFSIETKVKNLFVYGLCIPNSFNDEERYFIYIQENRIFLTKGNQLTSLNIHIDSHGFYDTDSFFYGYKMTINQIKNLILSSNKNLIN